MSAAVLPYSLLAHRPGEWLSQYPGDQGFRDRVQFDVGVLGDLARYLESAAGGNRWMAMRTPTATDKDCAGRPSLSVTVGRLDAMNGDEQLLRGRGFGHDHDDPDPGPRPGQRYAVLIGGPLDGLLLDVTGWRPEEMTARPWSRSSGSFLADARCKMRAPASHGQRVRVSAAVCTTPETPPDRCRPGHGGATRCRARACGEGPWSAMTAGGSLVLIDLPPRYALDGAE